MPTPSRISRSSAGLEAADQAGCGYYRMGLPYSTLRIQGLAETAVSTRMDLSVEWDVVVGQRISGGPQSKLFRAIGERDTMLVYEMDDDLFSLDPSNPAYEYYADAERQVEISKNLAASDLVTVTTENLARVAKEHTDAPIAVLPNCINVANFAKTRLTRKELRIGWAGSSTHYDDIAPFKGQIRRAVDRSGATFVSVGEDYTRLVGAAQSLYVGWEKDITKYYGLLDFQIGLAPLADTEFNRSKSPIKAMEYGARGIPVVASNVGPYAEYVEHGVDGFLVNADWEWSHYIGKLATDEKLRARMGKAAKMKAEHYDINVTAVDWLTAISETLSK